MVIQIESLNNHRGAKNIVLLDTSTRLRMESKSYSLRGHGRNFTVISLRCALEPITPTKATSA